MRIFAKTESGTVEIAKRQLQLSFIERSTLLMVDGQRSAEEICHRLGKIGDAAEAIAVLAELKLIKLAREVSGAYAPNASFTPARTGHDHASQQRQVA